MIIPFTGMIGTSPTSAFTITAFVLLMLYSQDCSEKQDIPLRCAESFVKFGSDSKENPHSKRRDVVRGPCSFLLLFLNPWP